MGKNDKKSFMWVLLKILGIIAIPASVFWILYRKDLFMIVDTIAVGILASTLIFLGIKFIFNLRIITFKK